MALLPQFEIFNLVSKYVGFTEKYYTFILELSFENLYLEFFLLNE